MAERGEFGSTSARSNFPARNFRLDEKTLLTRGEGIASFTAGWPVHKSLNFSGVSNTICASGNFSRNRNNAGVDITASPSQFVPRTRMWGAWRPGPGLGLPWRPWHSWRARLVLDSRLAARPFWAPAFQRRWTQNQFAGSRARRLRARRSTSCIMLRPGADGRFRE